MTRHDAVRLTYQMIQKVRAARNPAAVAQAAVLPLEIRALFTATEIRQVASFIYLMKRRTSASDADFVADQLSALVHRLEPDISGPDTIQDG